MVSFNSGRSHHEDQKTCVRHVRSNSCSRIRDRLGCAERGSQKEEESRGGATTRPDGAGTVADVLGSPLRTGLRDQGRPEVHLHQCLLCDERPGQSDKSRRLQGSQGRRQEKEGITAAVAAKQTGRCLAAARSLFARGSLSIFCAAESATTPRSGPWSAAYPETSASLRRQ